MVKVLLGRSIYRYNHKYGGKKFQTIHVTEDEVKASFIFYFDRNIVHYGE